MKKLCSDVFYVFCIRWYCVRHCMPCFWHLLRPLNLNSFVPPSPTSLPSLFLSFSPPHFSFTLILSHGPIGASKFSCLIKSHGIFATTLTEQTAQTNNPCIQNSKIIILYSKSRFELLNLFLLIIPGTISEGDGGAFLDRIHWHDANTKICHCQLSYSL